jgi:hypothetical protein
MSEKRARFEEGWSWLVQVHRQKYRPIQDLKLNVDLSLSGAGVSARASVTQMQKALHFGVSGGGGGNRVTALKLKTAAVVYYKTDMDTCH